MVKKLLYRYREIVPVQQYISFTGIYHWYGKKMRNSTYSDTACSDTPLIVTLWAGPKSFISRMSL